MRPRNLPTNRDQKLKKYMLMRTYTKRTQVGSKTYIFSKKITVRTQDFLNEHPVARARGNPSSSRLGLEELES